MRERMRDGAPEDERDAIAELEAVLGEPLAAVPSHLPADGPRTLYRGRSAVAWAGTEARMRDEHAGRSIAHPLAPERIASGARAIAIAGSGEPLADPIEPLVASVPRETVAARAPIGEHLTSLGGQISLPRALARAVGRSRADRLLARPLGIRTGVGPILGGIDPRWIRAGARGPATLSTRRVRVGWAALDLAAAEVHGLADLRAVHAGLGDDDAYDLALLAVALREWVLARDEAALERAREIVDRLAPRDPERVRVRLAGAPAWLERARWEGDDVPLAQARWIAREWGGLSVGGSIVRVETDPPIRAGRAAPAWRPRAERRRELFSRWSEGIRADDEGLFSATPEALAEQIAHGAHGTVVDATCGIGSIAIALARRPEVDRVIAIDRDRERLEMARHNAAICGVAGRIEFRAGDALEIVPRLAGELLVIDPPWGGRDYDRDRVGLAELAMDVGPLLAAWRGEIVLKLPRSFDVRELGEGWSLEAGVDGRGILKMLIARRKGALVR